MPARDSQFWGFHALQVQRELPSQDPEPRYRVTNWPEYAAALVQRGSLTVWLTDEAVEVWRAPATDKRNRQPVYSDIVIETGLVVRLCLHQPLLQTAGLLRSICRRTREPPIPHHTTISRRGGGLTILPKRVDRDEPPQHLLVDSTGLKIHGEGKWLDQRTYDQRTYMADAVLHQHFGAIKPAPTTISAHDGGRGSSVFRNISALQSNYAGNDRLAVRSSVMRHQAASFMRGHARIPLVICGWHCFSSSAKRCDAALFASHLR